jgi:hypothetical protein
MSLAWMKIAQTAFKVGSAFQEGHIKADALRAERKQMYRSEDSARATGTRQVAEINRQKEVLKSNAKAAMAAGGGVTDDAGAIESMDGIDKVMGYNALTAMYEANTIADDWKFKAKIKRWEEKNAKMEARRKAFGAILSGAADNQGGFGGFQKGAT